MKRLLFLLFALFATPAAAQQVNIFCPTGSQGLGLWQPCGSSGSPVFVSGTFTPSGTQNVNLTQILSAAVSVTNPLFVSPATGASWAVTGTVAFSNTTIATTNAGTFATQSAITAASGSFASGSQSIGITPTDRTVTSATGASQTVMSANATRKALTIENTGNANCGVNPTGGTAAIGGAGTITLAPLGSYTPSIPSLAAITAICTAGQPLYADEG